jgi:hypothetical protein
MGRRCVSDRHGRNEPISTPVHSLNELRVLGRIPEDSAELTNTPAHHRIADRCQAPDRIQQSVLRDHLARLCDQIPQHRKRFGSERKGLHTAPELLAAHVKPKGRKEENPVCIHVFLSTEISQKLHGFFTTSRLIPHILLQMTGSNVDPEGHT